MSAKHLFYNSPDIVEAGVDECGRGTLISRVYAGAVIWDPNIESTLIRDSKKIKKERDFNIAYDFIKENAIDFAFGYVEAEEIDKINILQASMKAMHLALDQLCIRPQHVLTDGNRFNYYMDPFNDDDVIPHTTIIEGDANYYSIAAASIIAKVERDRYMVSLCDEHPELNLYGIAKNKGYASAEHRKAIEQWGITPFHRKTFGICKRYASILNNNIIIKDEDDDE
jgi:ribonuclease HII